jgi:hypothetical protein
MNLKRVPSLKIESSLLVLKAGYRDSQQRSNETGQWTGGGGSSGSTKKPKKPKESRKPYKWRLARNPRRSKELDIYIFETDDGRNGEVEIHNHSQSTPRGTIPYSVMEIDFAVESEGMGGEMVGEDFVPEMEMSTSITQGGDARRIFSTVLDVAKEAIEKNKPDKVFLHADKERQNVDGKMEWVSGSRISLYEKFIERYMDKLGYTYDGRTVDTRDKRTVKMTLTRVGFEQPNKSLSLTNLGLKAGYKEDQVRSSETGQWTGSSGSTKKPKTTKPTESKEFKSWFGESKVVDEDGQPLIVYHGTPQGGFDEFKPATHFTDNPDYAAIYTNPSASSMGTGKRDDAKSVYPVYLSIKNPFDPRSSVEHKNLYEEFTRSFGNGTPLSDRGLPDWTDSYSLVEWIEEKGLDFDGLVLDEGGTPEGGSRGISYVPLSPNQIKSTLNQGEWNPDDPRITKSIKLKAGYKEDQTRSSETGQWTGSSGSAKKPKKPEKPKKPKSTEQKLVSLGRQDFPEDLSYEDFQNRYIIHGTEVSAEEDLTVLNPKIGATTSEAYGEYGELLKDELVFFANTEDVGTALQFSGSGWEEEGQEPYILLVDMSESSANFVKAGGSSEDTGRILRLDNNAGRIVESDETYELPFQVESNDIYTHENVDVDYAIRVKDLKEYYDVTDNGDIDGKMIYDFLRSSTQDNLFGEGHRKDPNQLPLFEKSIKLKAGYREDQTRSSDTGQWTGGGGSTKKPEKPEKPKKPETVEGGDTAAKPKRDRVIIHKLTKENIGTGVARYGHVGHNTENMEEYKQVKLFFVMDGDVYATTIEELADEMGEYAFDQIEGFVTHVQWGMFRSVAQNRGLTNVFSGRIDPVTERYSFSTSARGIKDDMETGEANLDAMRSYMDEHHPNFVEYTDEEVNDIVEGVWGKSLALTNFKLKAGYREDQQRSNETGQWTGSGAAKKPKKPKKEEPKSYLQEAIQGREEYGDHTASGVEYAMLDFEENLLNKNLSEFPKEDRIYENGVYKRQVEYILGLSDEEFAAINDYTLNSQAISDASGGIDDSSGAVEKSKLISGAIKNAPTLEGTGTLYSGGTLKHFIQFGKEKTTFPDYGKVMLEEMDRAGISITKDDLSVTSYSAGELNPKKSKEISDVFGEWAVKEINNSMGGEKIRLKRLMSTSTSEHVARKHSLGSTNIDLYNDLEYTKYMKKIGMPLHAGTIPSPECILRIKGTKRGLAIAPLAGKWQKELEVLIGGGNNDLEFNGATYDKELGRVYIDFEDRR